MIGADADVQLSRFLEAVKVSPAAGLEAMIVILEESTLAGWLAAAAFHRMTVAHLRGRAAQTRREWTGEDLSDEDRRANFADARRDEERAAVYEAAAEALERRAAEVKAQLDARDRAASSEA